MDSYVFRVIIQPNMLNLNIVISQMYITAVSHTIVTVVHVGLLLWWSGIRNMAGAIPTLHWRPGDRLTEKVLQFRVDVFLPHLVYPSVGRVSFFLVDLSRCRS